MKNKRMATAVPVSERPTELVMDCLDLVSEAPQGLRVIRIIFELLAEGEERIIAPMITGRKFRDTDNIVRKVSAASVYRTLSTLHKLNLIEFVEVDYENPPRPGPKPQGYVLTQRGTQLENVLREKMIARDVTPSRENQSYAPLKSASSTNAQIQKIVKEAPINP